MKVTIITDMTDSEILKTYWCPLVCKHREVDFIFGKSENVKRPKMKYWSNVRFTATKGRDRLVKFAKADMVYMTVQDEIPTYELMVLLTGKPKEGIVPKIHGTDKDSLSYTVKKNNYNGERPDFKTTFSNVTTYKI